MIVIILTIEEMTEEVIEEMTGGTIKDMMMEIPGMIEIPGMTNDGIPGTQGINHQELHLPPSQDSRDMLETRDMMITTQGLNSSHTEHLDFNHNTPISRLRLVNQRNILTKTLNIHNTEIQLVQFRFLPQDIHQDTRPQYPLIAKEYTRTRERQ